jgi:hypothetical protein
MDKYMSPQEQEFWEQEFDGYDPSGEPEGVASVDDFEVLPSPLATMEALVMVQARIVQVFVELDGVVREGDRRFMAHREGVEAYGDTPYLAICNLMLQLRTLH